MASLITKRFSVLPSLTKYFLQKSSSKSLSSTSFLLQQAKVQHPAPEFKGQAVVDGQFKEVSLSDFKGKWLVLFFYPLDFTFVRIDLIKLLAIMERNPFRSLHFNWVADWTTIYKIGFFFRFVWPATLAMDSKWKIMMNILWNCLISMRFPLLFVWTIGY